MANHPFHQRYSGPIIGLHWLMLLLIVALYATVQLHEAFPKGSEPGAALMKWHFMLGALAFFLALVRVLARFMTARPPIFPQPPRWQEFAAKLAHLALYGFLVLMPLLGWLMLSAAGKPIPFFGLELPALIGPDEGLARTFKEIHETIGELGYFLIGLHAAAALFHHYMGDNTLRRMLPERAVQE